jgi:Domain of unknown function (DUF4157)
MKTLATKQPVQDSAKQLQDRTRSTLTPVEIRSNTISPLSTGMPLIQRQCACGGGCPRCQDNLTLQTKLKIGEPGDVYEQEADRIADEVMRMPEPTIQRQMEPEEDVEEMVQTKAISNSITPLQRSATAPNQASEVPEIVNDVLRSPGQPLDPAIRNFMEPRFGNDFSHVRIHTDTKAAASAQSVHAAAYTVRNHIVFGEGQHNPKNNLGKQLLAHELTHVLQQSSINSDSTIILPEDSIKKKYQQISSPVSQAVQEPLSINIAPRSPGLQRELLAYKTEYSKIIQIPDINSANINIIYSADADALKQVLQPLIVNNKVGFADDGKRIFFYNKAATQSDIQLALTIGSYPRAAEMATALLDNHNVYIYSHERLDRMDTFFGLSSSTRGRESQVVESQTERLLTDYEKVEARRVFGNNLNYDSITVVEDPLMTIGFSSWKVVSNTARTLPSSIYFPPGSSKTSNFMAWLIHELTHSWQYQHGTSIAKTLWHSLNTSNYAYGGEAGLRQAYTSGKSFSSFNTEAQGDICRDYYIRLKATPPEDISAWQPFITELQTGVLPKPPSSVP